MTLKHTFSSKPNPRYNEAELKKKLRIEQKLDKAKGDITKGDAASHEYLEVVKSTIDNHLRQVRTDIKSMMKEPKLLKEVHITSDKKWTIFPEVIGDECGRTRYEKPQLISVDIKVPYSRMLPKLALDGSAKYDDEDNLILEEANVKAALRAAGDKALAPLKEYRKKRKELQKMEKTVNFFTPLPYPVKYMVYAGNGHGGPATTYRYKDVLRGTDLEITKPEQKDNFFIHMEGGTFLKLQEVARTRKVFERKAPRTSDNHVGIEIEFVSKMDKFELAKELCKENVQDFVFLTDDGSIKFYDKEGNVIEKAQDEFKFKHELTMVAPEVMIHEVIRRVLKAVNQDGKSKVGARCGLHVHLDMRSRDKKLAFHNLSKAQRIMYAMNPRSRLDGVNEKGKKDTVWSKKLDVSDFDEAARVVASSGGESRYFGINILALDKHQTIEIRIHSGSTNYEKISNWVRILTSVVNTPNRVDAEAAKAETFCDYYGLDQSICDYINTRMAKFKDKEGKHITVTEVA